MQTGNSLGLKNYYPNNPFLCGNCVAVWTNPKSHVSTGNVVGMSRWLDLCREGKVVSDHSRYHCKLLKLLAGVRLLHGLPLAILDVQPDDCFQ